MGRGIGVTETIRDGAPAWLVDLASLVTLLGDWLIIVSLLALLYLLDVAYSLRQTVATPTTDSLCSDRTVFLIATVFGGLSLILLLESVFALSRPPEALHAVSPGEYGFPSGHTMAATIFWGALAMWLPRGRIQIRTVIATTIVTIVALSRLVLGVHYLIDIFAAIAFGMLYLVAIDRVLRDRPVAVFGIAFLIALAAVGTTSASTRAVLAVGGTVAAILGWQIVEWPPIRSRLRKIGQILTT